MTVVDLFAGPGGWDEGLRLLGRTDVVGLEHDGAACATRRAAGHATVQADVAALDPADFADVEGLIASPPCQAFSVAGKRGARADAPRLRAHLLASIGGWVDPGGGWTDPRAPLVLEPLRWALALRPTWIALEQVPPVAALWQTMAVAFETHGWACWVGLVNAADYGVPQTRQRAVLLAHRDRRPSRPRRTHVGRWASMADALGWDPGSRWLVSSHQRNTALRSDRQPAPTVPCTWDNGDARWLTAPVDLKAPGTGEPWWPADSVRVEPAEGAVLQSFPRLPVAGPTGEGVGADRQRGPAPAGRPPARRSHQHPAPPAFALPPGPGACRPDLGPVDLAVMAAAAETGRLVP